MYIQVFDLQTLIPVANLTALASGSCSLLHNASGSTTVHVLADSNEIAPLVMTDGRFDLNKMLRAPSLWMAHVRDGADGNLRMQGRLLIEPSEDGNYYIVTVSDLLDELRMISLPPQRFFNGPMTEVIKAILSFMPPASRRRDAPRPTTDFITNERWELLDASHAVNGWTSLDGSNMTCLEAIIAVCDATGNNFRLNYDQTRNMRGLIIYDQPPGRNRPRANITLGGFHAKENAQYNLTLTGQPVMVIENDTVLAGLIPEGGSYQDADQISRILRLTGVEEVPKGYRLENWHGYWGVFNESLVGSPVSSALPAGQIRTEAFGSIVPMVNTHESISVVVDKIDGRYIYSSALDGHEDNHWKDATVSFGEIEVTVLSSVGNVILLSDDLPVAVNDIVSVEVFREWDEEKVKDSRQSLTGAAVALLKSNEKVLATWKVRVPSPPWRLRLADYVRLIYSGAVQVRHWQSDVTKFVSHVSLSDVFVITTIEIVQGEDGIEYQDLTLAERMWRFPSNSGLREIMALIQRRMPGVRMGREGAAVGSGQNEEGEGRTPESIAPGSIKDSHIAWGTGAEQVSAADVPIADHDNYYTAGDVEGALQEIGAALSGGIGGASDAADVTYTPTNLTNWIDDADPGNVDDALDQLAERVADIEVNVGHDAVTLDADADALLKLSAQEIGLDAQAAATVFAGPATGSAAAPTFRALLTTDLPAINLDDLNDVDVGALNDGDVLTWDNSESKWVAASPAGNGSVASDTIWDAKGDLAVGSGVDAATRLEVGSDGQVLMADSSATLGMKWADIPENDNPSFLDLTDTPASYANQAGKLVAVKGDSSGLEFVAAPEVGEDVTLAADADVLLGLNGQELTLDAQAANQVFAGPASGSAADPTFRALVAADLGSGTASNSNFLRGDLTWAAPSVAKTLVFFVAGTLAVGSVPLRLHAPEAMTIVNVTAAVDTAPTGASVIVDVNKNGSTIFTTQANRPTIAATTTEDLSSAPDVTALAQNDVVTIDVDQIGSTVAGADLVVQIRCTVP